MRIYIIFLFLFMIQIKNRHLRHIYVLFLTRFVNFRKDFSTAWMNLGIVQSALKKYEESEVSYFMALQHRSNYPDCYYNLGVLVSTL